VLHLKQIETIVEDDLLALIKAQVREGQRIDYKREINLSVPKSKHEFLRDVSSFANASGGDLVCGMEEVDGLPTSLYGIAKTDFENLQQQISQICRSNLDPSLVGIRAMPVALKDGRFALVIRIPKTWNSPHMVMMDGENRCWTRDQSGKRMMEIPDLKQAIAFSENAAMRMKKFRMERIGNFVAKETPIPITSNQAIILHLLPLVSFTTNFEIDPSKAGDSAIPVPRSDSNNVTFDLEGKLAYSSVRDLPPYAYTLVFRTGVIEAVCADLKPWANSHIEGDYFFPWHWDIVLKPFPRLMKLSKALEIPLPIFGALSLAGVKGFKIYPTNPGAYVPFAFPFQRDLMILPEFIIENYDSSPEAVLGRTLDMWWQACGWDERRR
jgi:hypothetical protein